MVPLVRPEPEPTPKKAISTTQINSEGKSKRKNLKIKSNVASLTKQYARFLFVSANLNKDKDVFRK